MSSTKSVRRKSSEPKRATFVGFFSGWLACLVLFFFLLCWVGWFLFPFWLGLVGFCFLLVGLGVFFLLVGLVFVFSFCLVGFLLDILVTLGFFNEFLIVFKEVLRIFL